MGLDRACSVPEFDREYAQKGCSCVEGKGGVYKVLG